MTLIVMDAAGLYECAAVLRATSGGYQEVARSLVTADGYWSLPPQVRDTVEGTLGSIESRLQWLSSEFEHEAVDLECRADLAAQPGDGLAPLAVGGSVGMTQSSYSVAAPPTSAFGLGAGVNNAAVGVLLIGGAAASTAPAAGLSLTIPPPAAAPPLSGGSLLIGGGTTSPTSSVPTLAIGSGYGSGSLQPGGSLAIPIGSTPQPAFAGSLAVGPSVGQPAGGLGSIPINVAGLVGSGPESALINHGYASLGAGGIPFTMAFNTPYSTGASPDVRTSLFYDPNAPERGFINP